MAKDRTPTGRVTPKGTPAPTTSGRYTPPVPKTVRASPPWVPVLIGTLLGLGAIVIILDYLGILPGGTSNIYLLIGLALITGGFITATQWH
jgi:hypothetical protein